MDLEALKAVPRAIPMLKIEYFQFHIFDSIVEFKVGHYQNGRTALQIVTLEGELYATLTINMPEVMLEVDEVIIKTYSENEYVALEAWKTGLFEDTGRRVYNLGVPIWQIK